MRLEKGRHSPWEPWFVAPAGILINCLTGRKEGLSSQWAAHPTLTLSWIQSSISLIQSTSLKWVSFIQWTIYLHPKVSGGQGHVPNSILFGEIKQSIHFTLGSEGFPKSAASDHPIIYKECMAVSGPVPNDSLVPTRRSFVNEVYWIPLLQKRHNPSVWSDQDNPLANIDKSYQPGTNPYRTPPRKAGWLLIIIITRAIFIKNGCFHHCRFWCKSTHWFLLLWYHLLTMRRWALKHDNTSRQCSLRWGPLFKKTLSIYQRFPWSAPFLCQWFMAKHWNIEHYQRCLSWKTHYLINLINSWIPRRLALDLFNQFRNIYFWLILLSGDPIPFDEKERWSTKDGKPKMAKDGDREQASFGIHQERGDCRAALQGLPFPQPTIRNIGNIWEATWDPAMFLFESSCLVSCRTGEVQRLGKNSMLFATSLLMPLYNPLLPSSNPSINLRSFLQPMSHTFTLNLTAQHPNSPLHGSKTTHSRFESDIIQPGVKRNSIIDIEVALPLKDCMSRCFVINQNVIYLQPMLGTRLWLLVYSHLTKQSSIMGLEHAITYTISARRWSISNSNIPVAAWIGLALEGNHDANKLIPAIPGKFDTQNIFSKDTQEDKLTPKEHHSYFFQKICICIFNRICKNTYL